MIRSACIFAAAIVAWSTARADSIGIAIGDFAYVDTSGEATDQVAVHGEQLRGFMAALRRDFDEQGAYHLVPLSCTTSCMDVDLAELARTASAAGAKIMVIGGIHKMSTLVQWARVEAIDVDANRVVCDRLFTFRGDNTQAWDRAEAFIVREVREQLAASGTVPIAPAPGQRLGGASPSTCNGGSGSAGLKPNTCP